MTVSNIIRDKMTSHWYYPDGREAFEVESADGKKMVSTTLTQAKRLGLFPSVTTLMKIMAKEEIVIWRISRAIKAAIMLKRAKGERLRGFIGRILDAAKSKSDKAMGFGSDVHEYIEEKLMGRITINNIPKETIKAIDKYIEDNIVSAEVEKIIVGDGYAGKIDCLATLKDGTTCLYDFKTQGTKENKPATFYDDFIIQLGGYQAQVKADKVRVLIISSKEAGRLEEKEYTPEEIKWGMDTFMACRNLFKLKKKI